MTKAIANAQRKVESRNFDIRKQLLEYDDVANDQRRAIYSQRNELLDVSDVSETINSIREDVFKATIDAYIPPQSLEEMWDIPGLQERLKNDFDLDLPIAEWLDKEPELHEETLRERILAQSIEVYQRKEEVVGAEMMRHFEKRRHAANSRLSVERAPGSDGLSASGYPPAWLCTERSEAGIQT